MISDSIKAISSMTEMAVVERAIADLIKKRREDILKERKKTGGQVGFIQRQRIDKKIVQQMCNATVKDVKNGYGFVEVVAPIRWAGRLVQVDMGLLREPFNIVDKVMTELTDDGCEPDSDPSDGNPLPIPLG